MSAVMALAAQLEPTWPGISAGIPPWHPRNEGEGGAGAGTATPPASTPPPPPQDPEVAKAYEKLRDAESKLAGHTALQEEKNSLEKRLKKLEREQMTADEKKAAEQAEKDNEIKDLRSRLDARELRENIADLAKELKLKNPDKAYRLVPSDAKDAKSVRAALEDAIKDFPELVGTGAAPPPVNTPSSAGAGSVNARMNAEIRRASGRG